MDFLSGISTLIFPQKCLLCAVYNENISAETGRCRKCSEILQFNVRSTKRGGIEIFAGTNYSPQMARLILAAKESNHKFARRYLAQSILASLKLAMLSQTQHPNYEKRIILIPIPSRNGANRLRGYAHILKLIDEIFILNTEHKLLQINCLAHKKRIKDQSSLNFHEREQNMKEAFGVKSEGLEQIAHTNSKGEAAPLIFLVDDLVTSGATVMAANIALNHAGIRVSGVLSSCASDRFTH
jgi:predicted amidophosphoribosyltransferase